MKFENNNIITITDVAVTKFKEMLLDSSEQDSFLRISLELEGTKMYYNMDTVVNPFEGDKAYDFNGLKVLINEEDEMLLNGLVVDYISDDLGENFTIENPNMITELDDDGSTGGCGCGCGHC